MPYGAAQVLLELIDADAGDDEFNALHDDIDTILKERMILFEFSDHERKKDQLKIVLRNQDFAILENSLFVKGQKFAVTWGWPGRMKNPRRMVVTKVKGGNPMSVFMLDTTQLFDKEKVSRDWENATDSEVVRELAHGHGYRGTFLHIDETTSRHDVVQRFMTDARFIAKLARRNGFEFWVDSSGLHWHKRRTTGDSAKTYIYRTDPGVGDILGEPKFDVNLSKGVSKVKVIARDPRTKQIWEKIGGPDNTEFDSIGEEDEMGNPDDTEQGLRAGRLSRIDVRYSGMLTEQEAQEEANARYREEVKGRYKMSFEAIGDSHVGAKLLISVFGISDSWDGMFYVQECIDTIQGGKFTQKIKTQKDALGKVWASRVRKQGKKEKQNPNRKKKKEEVASYDFTEMKTVRTLTTGPDGSPAVVNMWVTNEGEILEQYDFAGLNVTQEQVEFFAMFGAQSIPPDAGK